MKVTRIFKQTAIPLYYQLQETLRDKIENNDWKPGEQLPTEKELCKEYNLSRITVRHALQLLELEGTIRRDRGKRTIVSKPKVHELLLQSITGSYSADYPRGGRLSTKLLELNVEKPSESIRIVLGLTDKQKAIKIVRIRLVEGDPLYWTTAYVPYDLCPTLVNDDFENRSFFEILEHKYNLFVQRSVRTIYTVLATNREINYLEIKPGAPLNVVESVSYLDDGTAIEYSKSYFRGDRTKFEVVIHR